MKPTDTSVSAEKYSIQYTVGHIENQELDNMFKWVKLTHDVVDSSQDIITKTNLNIIVAKNKL